MLFRNVESQIINTQNIILFFVFLLFLSEVVSLLLICNTYILSFFENWIFVLLFPVSIGYLFHDRAM